MPPYGFENSITREHRGVPYTASEEDFNSPNPLVANYPWRVNGNFAGRDGDRLMHAALLNGADLLREGAQTVCLRNEPSCKAFIDTMHEMGWIPSSRTEDERIERAVEAAKRVRTEVGMDLNDAAVARLVEAALRAL